jgi:hypothetical protein
MVKIVARQINWNGQGKDREFPYWVKPGQVDLKIRDIERAYNMDHTVIEVIR